MRFIDRRSRAAAYLRGVYSDCARGDDCILEGPNQTAASLADSFVEGPAIWRHARGHGRQRSVRREADQRISGQLRQGTAIAPGVVILFDPESGAAVCVVDAGEVTAIRTAAASAVATDALARKDARRLAILGYGEQAATHARAIGKVRGLESIVVWGRSIERARAFAERMQAELGVPVSERRECGRGGG